MTTEMSAGNFEATRCAVSHLRHAPTGQRSAGRERKKIGRLDDEISG